MDRITLKGGVKLGSGGAVFNPKSYDSFLSLDGEIRSFDHNAEADYLLSSMNSPSVGGLRAGHPLNMRFDGWAGHNPLYKFPNEDTYSAFQLGEAGSQHDLILKYLNGVDFDKGLHPSDAARLLECLPAAKARHVERLDPAADLRSREKSLSFEQASPKSHKGDRPESSYITEGSGTIMKIIEASQLWLKHTSADKVPIRLKKQFTKNDNFVVLIKKQLNH